MKSPKTSSKPKRPVNAFMLYKTAMKSKLFQQHKTCRSQELSKHAAERWRQEPDHVKQYYRDRSRADQERYRQEVLCGIRAEGNLNDEEKEPKKPEIVSKVDAISEIDQWLARPRCRERIVSPPKRDPSRSSSISELNYPRNSNMKDLTTPIRSPPERDTSHSASVSDKNYLNDTHLKLMPGYHGTDLPKVHPISDIDQWLRRSSRQEGIPSPPKRDATRSASISDSTYTGDSNMKDLTAYHPTQLSTPRLPSPPECDSSRSASMLGQNCLIDSNLNYISSYQPTTLSTPRIPSPPKLDTSHSASISGPNYPTDSHLNHMSGNDTMQLPEAEPLSEIDQWLRRSSRQEGIPSPPKRNASRSASISKSTYTSDSHIHHLSGLHSTQSYRGHCRTASLPTPINRGYYTQIHTAHPHSNDMQQMYPLVQYPILSPNPSMPFRLDPGNVLNGNGNNLCLELASSGESRFINDAGLPLYRPFYQGNGS